MMRLIIAMPDAVLIAHRRANGYTTRLELKECSPQCGAFDPLRPERLYCGTFGHGLWRSIDAGDTWEPVADLAPRQVTAVAVSGFQSEGGVGVVYAGTEPSALFRSDDGGATWQECSGFLSLPSARTWSFPPRPETHHVRWIAPDPIVAGRLFLAIEAGALLRSLDYGATWEDRRPDSPYDTHTLAAHPLARDRLCSAAGDGYFESWDAGLSWGQPEAGLQHHYLWSLVIDPADPDLILVSASRGPQSAHSARMAEAYVYRRERGGEWQPVRTGLPTPGGTTVSALAADPFGRHTFYAVNNRGIYRSSDRGLAWEKLEIPWPEHFRAQRPQALIALPD
jgi:hypothetical protein